MVLRRSHHADILAIDEREDGAFRPSQHLLDDHGGTSTAETSGEAVLDCSACLGIIGGDDHALARCETIRLDDDGRRVLVEIGERRCLVIEAAICRGRETVGVHEMLAERLAALDAGSCGTGTEAGDTRLTHDIGDTRDQRGLGADHDKTDTVLLRETGHCGTVTDVECDVAGDLGGATVARRHIDLVG